MNSYLSNIKVWTKKFRKVVRFQMAWAIWKYLSKKVKRSFSLQLSFGPAKESGPNVCEANKPSRELESSNQQSSFILPFVEKLCSQLSILKLTLLSLRVFLEQSEQKCIEKTPYPLPITLYPILIYLMKLLISGFIFIPLYPSRKFGVVCDKSSCIDIALKVLQEIVIIQWIGLVNGLVVIF